MAELSNSACPFDYETESTFTVTIKVSDNGEPSMSHNFLLELSITDVNESPKVTGLTNYDVNENEPVGAHVATVVAEDKDIGDSLNFTLITDGDGKFAINGSRIFVRERLNYEKKKIHVIAVLVADSGIPTFTVSE